MNTLPNSSKVLTSGVLIAPDSMAVEYIINPQYNPASLSRSLRLQTLRASGGWALWAVAGAGRHRGGTVAVIRRGP